jgi:hypothetical protein
MHMPRKWKLAAAVVVALAVAAGAVAGVFFVSGYGERSVTVAGDRVGCVYSAASSGHQFKRSIPPGQKVGISNSDELVLLPTGDQIYNITTSGNRTQLAPARVLAFTKGQTAVWVEGVLKFRFNTAGDRACKWYSKYGLQTASYGDLGFAVRSGIEERQTGWYRFLAKAHGDTMRQVVHDGSSAWTWQELAYGSDPTINAKPTSEPVSVGYGKHIGAMFTKYLALNLGDRYFCGVQPGLTGVGPEEGCPPMYFQILSVDPRDESLAEEHDKLKRLDAELTRQRQAAKLKAMNRSVAIASAKAQRKVLEQQIVNTRLDAQNDVRIQKCLILARVELDCDGKKQPIIVAGAPASTK